MKLTLLFLLTSFLQVNNAYANDEDITIKKDNASLETVIREIEKQCTYKFFFSEILMKQARPVTINVEKASLSETLDACFKTQPLLTYAIVEKTIIVKKKEEKKDKLGTARDFEKLAELRGLVSSEHGPIPGATVSVKGAANKATTTNNAGEFVLYDVDSKAVLVVSSVAHYEQEIRLNGKGIVNIILDEKVGELDEQIVVAYNKSTKKSNVGSVTVIKGEEVRDLPYRSVDKALQGLVPGLLVTNGTGQPGGGVSNFVLRGIATGGDATFGSTVRNPLIVIDGIPVTQDHNQWMIGLDNAPVINPLAQLNSSDIETISVLKDAAAIALYGSKASNGVILITTKKGKAGKTVFSIRHQTDLSKRIQGKIDMLNQQEYLDLLYETYKNTPRIVNGDPVPWTDADILADLQSKFPMRADGSFYPAINWEDELYTDAATTLSNEISMSGGNEKSNFYLNLEYTKQNGVYKKTGYDRKSVRFNFENRPTQWLKIGLNTALSYSIQDYVSLTGATHPVGTVLLNTPLLPVRLENGEYLLNFDFPELSANPVAVAEYNKKRNIAYRGLSRIYGEVNFLRDFTFSSSLGVDFMLMVGKEKFDSRLYDDETYSVGIGRLQQRDNRDINLITTNTLRYNKLINTDHSVNLLVAQEAQIMSQSYLEGYGTGSRSPIYDLLSNSLTTYAVDGFTKQTLLSYFAQGNYGFKNKYFFSGSVRRDGSSRFGEHNRFGTYWSTGLGYVISSENFMKNVSWVNYLKIRGSIGAAGNSSPVDKFARFDLLAPQSFQNNIAVTPATLGNPDIKWEHTFTWDAGLEARFWNNRIAITADIYNRKTSDLIYVVTLPYVTGWQFIADNIGDMENKGIELSLSLDVVRTKNFKFSINGNWSSNKNILVKANVPLAAVSGNTIGNEEGRNFNSFYLVRWAGVDPVTGSGQWFDEEENITTSYPDAARKFVGKPQPDGFGALSPSIAYKNISVSALFYYQYGFQVYDSYLLTNDGGMPYYNQDKRALDRWRKPGDVAANPIRTLYDPYAGQPSTRYLYDGDYLRLQNLMVSYNFPKRITELLQLSSLRLFFQGQNLGLWTKFPGNDPAVAGSQGTSSVSTYPNQKTFSFGVNANF